jgi:hypothetical protein
MAKETEVLVTPTRTNREAMKALLLVQSYAGVSSVYKPMPPIGKVLCFKVELTEEQTTSHLLRAPQNVYV